MSAKKKSSKAKGTTGTKRKKASLPLIEYKKKRRAERTPEPEAIAASSPTGRLFVVQKHDATRLHYDFRIEMDGVLKSWAVPKGPSLDPAEKRLAVEVEDHPVAYGDFEGVIPEGEYGGGTVQLWDRGEWLPQGADPKAELAGGSLKIELFGMKMKGKWALVRMKPRPGDKAPQWLLIKERDSYVRRTGEYDLLTAEPRSVTTGRTIEEIAAAKDAVWHSHARQSAGTPVPAMTALPFEPSTPLTEIAGACPASFPGTVEIALATATPTTPNGKEWIHEIKLDGYRILCELSNGTAKLWTRGRQDWSHRYRAILHALEQLDATNAILDGELVALDPHGVSSLSLLHNASEEGRTDQLVYFVFDLLFLNGYDLRKTRLGIRKQLLSELIRTLAHQRRVQWLDHFEGDGPEFFRQCCKMGLEGTISKRIDKPYPAGRKGDWVKSKCLQKDEFFIGGFTDSTTTRRGFGALLLGYWDDRHQAHFVGHVGTGFSEKSILEIRRLLEPLRENMCPFVNVANTKVRGTHWVRPELVANIAYQTWTADGILRHPSFQGLADDKPANEVTRPATLDWLRESKPRSSSTHRLKKRNSPARIAPEEADSSAACTIAGVRITHPDRILFASQGISKLGLIAYYREVSAWILPYIRNRPLSLVRCPGGASGACFYQKHVMPGMPDVLERITIQEDKKSAQYIMVRDEAGLVALVQFGVLEIHPWGSTAASLETPDRLIFDLDPAPDVAWSRVLEAAREVRDRLLQIKLESYVKTTGGKGLHVVLPIQPKWQWPEIKTFCNRLADQMVADAPADFTTSLSKARRTGKILVDYLRNDRGATAVAAYSTRAKEGAPVSVPISWEDLSPAMTSDRFHVTSVLTRLKSLTEDPWREFWKSGQSLTKVAYRKIVGTSL